MVERGVGRLLTTAELRTWPEGTLRSAFVIDDRHALTAWHCVRKAGGTQARLWLRLHHPAAPDGCVIVPLGYVHHVADLDAALLALDDDRAGDDAGALRRHLAAVALPLGTEVREYDEGRIAGFPQLNPAVETIALIGQVSSAEAVVGRARAIRLHVREMAAAYGESPHGMSGGPLLRREPGGAERVVGIVSNFPPAPAGAGTLGGEVLCRAVADLREAFPPVAEALRHAPAGPAPVVELSSDVADRYRPVLVAAHVAPPVHWTGPELAAVADRIEVLGAGASRVADTVLALRRAAAARTVCAGFGAHTVELGRLQSIYRREVGAWPTGTSVDALLVEAADADLHERRAGTAPALRALTRFVVGVAAAVGASPAAFASWIAGQGHQLANAEDLYAGRRDSSAWLLLDLGDEPGPGEPPWPAAVGWTFVSTGDDIVGRVPCARTPDGLLEALKTVLRTVPSARSLLVDLAVPHALLSKGIEHWPVREVDDEPEPLSAWARPRLRWSRRRRQPALHERLVERTGRARWETIPDPLPDDLLADHQRLRERIRDEAHEPWQLGTAPPERADTLRILLREGCGFVVWFPAVLQPAQHDNIRSAVSGVSAPARRQVLPDELPRFPGLRPAVIWDDPRGRAQFSLPPLAAAESV
ncbi:trypsin-like peptidase domain-containing protein [Dactylosporangium sp. NPDC050688]|uniref:trypsin-like peptidase domain-containing protein n=1 Tax=Dactylosporangium sp. NPDC050688 TaxID=3157217 RepID=UPI00340BD395